MGVGLASCTAACPTRTVLVAVWVAVDTGVEVTASGVNVVVGVTIVVSVGTEVVTHVEVTVGVVVSVASTFLVSVEMVRTVVADVVVTVVFGVDSDMQLHPEEMIDDLKDCRTLGIVATPRFALPQIVEVNTVVIVVNETCCSSVNKRSIGFRVHHRTYSNHCRSRCPLSCSVSDDGF